MPKAAVMEVMLKSRELARISMISELQDALGLIWRDEFEPTGLTATSGRSMDSVKLVMRLCIGVAGSEMVMGKGELPR